MAIPQTTAERVASRSGTKRRRHKHVWKDKHWRWVADRRTATGASRATSSATSTSRSSTTSAGPGRSRRAAAAPRRRAAPPPPTGDPRPPGAYQGPFGVAQAMRLLNRAGFGPVPGQAEQLVSLGLVGAVQSLTRPSGAASLIGPAPIDDDGNPIAPADAWGHDHLWWLDRMVRTDQPLVERMALVFHDWFATSQAGVSKQQQMIDQSNLFRARCFGSFLDLFKAVTVDPAMLQWLNGTENTQVGAERELRAGDDGAVQPRRRPRRLQRGRRPRSRRGR